MVVTGSQTTESEPKGGAERKARPSRSQEAENLDSSSSGQDMRSPQVPSLMWAVLVVVPWALFLGPYLSPAWRDQVHTPYVHRTLLEVLQGKLDFEDHVEASACAANLNSTAGADDDRDLHIPNSSNERLKQGKPVFLEVGSTVEVMDVAETDDPNQIYWYKAEVLSVEGDGSFRILYTMDDTDDVKGENVIREYVPPRLHDFVEVYIDEKFHKARINKVSTDGTLFDLYVDNYGQIFEYVNGGLLRRFEPKEKPTFTLEPNTSIHKYLNPKLLEDPNTFKEIGERLRAGELVVIRDAFRPEFAEAMHYDLYNTENWDLFEFYDTDGFHYHHHNIYDEEDYSEFMSATKDIFGHPDTKEWISGLTKKDCSGSLLGTPSYYMPGDYSMPHSDFKDERTVAYVWHLSDNWRPEWGGALYWASELSYDAFQHASFNTLVLFVVQPLSMHFVTGVSQKAMDKRLTFNGWWSSNYEPKVDDPFEEWFATPEQRYNLSRKPFNWIVNLDLDLLPPERHEEVAEVQRQLVLMEYPEKSLIHEVIPNEL